MSARAGNLGTCPLPDLIASTPLTASAGQLMLATLLFLRWIDFDEAERESMAAFEDAPFDPSLSEALHWRRWHRLPSNELGRFLTDRLAPALRQLTPVTGSPVLGSLPLFSQDVERLGQLHSAALAALVAWVAALPFETSRDRQRALAAFDDGCAKVSARHIEQTGTDPGIARLMAAIARPWPGQQVYDPCFGVGETLIAASRFAAEERNLRAQGIDADHGRPLAAARGIAVFGIEQNQDAYRIGLTRVLLAGIDEPRLELDNTLERPALIDDLPGGFDLVLADPPMGARTQAPGISQFAVPSTDVAALMLQHAMLHLRPGGRAVVLVANGLLSNKIHQKLRQWLLERHRVEAIVALPARALPHTAVQASILLLGANGPSDSVRMVDAGAFWDRHSGWKGPILPPEAADAIAAAVHADQVEGPAWEVSLADIAAADWDLTPRRRQITELDRALANLGELVEVKPLGDLAEVSLGRNIPTSERLEDPTDTDNAVPLLNVKSLGRGSRQAAAWVARERLSEVDLQNRLRVGDVLLSRAGTIGKAALVSNDHVGGMAGSNLYVLRAAEDSVDPHYLAAFLASSAAKAWMTEQAQGAAILSLSKANLARLPVPVPPLQIQARIADNHRRHGSDAFEFLTRLLSTRDEDPVASSISRWLEEKTTDLSAARLPPETPRLIAEIEEWSKDLAPVRRCVQCHNPHWLDGYEHHESHYGWPDFYERAPEGMCLACWFDVNDDAETSDFEGGGPLVYWCLDVNEALLSLRGIAEVPPPTQMHLLKDSARALADALSRISGHMPDEDRARTVTAALDERVQWAMKGLLDAVDIQFEAEDAVIDARSQFEIPVRVTNRSALPLRDLDLDSSPYQGGGSIKFLPEQGSASIVLKGTRVEGKDELPVRLTWTARDLTGQTRRGEHDLMLAIPKALSGESIDLGASPYVCANPVDPSRDDVFFGRDQELDQIRRQVLESANVVLLEGNRRAGKSSILKHLEGPEPIPGWLGVYSSLQGAEGSDEGTGVPTADVFRQFSADIAKAVHGLGLDTPLPDGRELAAGKKPIGIARACRAGIAAEGAFNDFREYLTVLLDLAATRGCGVLLLLDEFDKLQEGIDNGITSPQVPENIRFLVQTLPRFSAVLTGSLRLKRLREEYWSALFGLGTRIGVSYLPEEAARRLVTEPVSGRLNYRDEAVNRTIALTAAHPFLLQNLCNRVFDLAARGRSRSVSVETVEAAAAELVQDNEHFAALWGYAASNRRRCILALCHREAAKDEALRFGEVSDRLADLGVEVADETLERDLEHLRELELLRLDGSGDFARYHLAVPLMGLWIDQQQDFDGVLAQARIETEEEHD